MKSKGTVIALIIILVAGMALFFAYLNSNRGSDPPENTSAEISELFVPPTTTTAEITTQASTEESTGTTVEAAITTIAMTAQNNAYPFNYPGIAPAVAAVPHDPYMILVNRNYALPASFSFSRATAAPGYQIELHTTAAEAYSRMYAAGRRDGVTLTPYSGFRSTQRQREIFENSIQNYRNQGYTLEQAVNMTAMWINPPGCSEHETGLAIDIWDTKESFENTAEFAWLMANAQDYGFILRYPKGKEEITMVNYEPWHWRFVGVENARSIKASGLVLEEYVNR